MNKFIQELAEIFDESNMQHLCATTQFRDLPEWSSLAALGIILLADEEYKATINANDLAGVQTIEELYNLIQSKAA